MLATVVLTPSIWAPYCPWARSSSANASPSLADALPTRVRICSTTSVRYDPCDARGIKYALHVFLVADIDLHPFHLLLSQLHIGLENEDVLLGFGELRFKLRDFDFVGTTVELEEWLTLLHWHPLVDQPFGDKSGFGQVGWWAGPLSRWSSRARQIGCR